MRAVINVLQQVTPMTLEAELVGSRSGEISLVPVIRFGASGGISWFLTITSNNGAHDYYSDMPSDAIGDVGLNLQLGPGEWQLVASRAGISDIGFVSLSKALGAITVFAHPEAPSHSPPTSTNPVGVTCGAELDLNDPGGQGVTGMRVFGGGMQPGESVDILEQGVALATTMADAFGGYRAHVSVVESTYPTQHNVYAVGETSGRMSNKVGFTV